MTFPHIWLAFALTLMGLENWMKYLPCERLPSTGRLFGPIASSTTLLVLPLEKKSKLSLGLRDGFITYFIP